MLDVVEFQGTIAVTDTPQNLPNNPIQNGVTITALAANSASIVVSANPAVTTSTGFPIQKGTSVFIALNGNTNQLWAVGTGTDKYSVIGT